MDYILNKEKLNRKHKINKIVQALTQTRSQCLHFFCDVLAKGGESYAI